MKLNYTWEHMQGKSWIEVHMMVERLEDVIARCSVSLPFVSLTHHSPSLTLTDPATLLFTHTHTHTYTPNVKMTSVAALSSCLTLNREVAVLLSLSLVRDYHIYKLPVPCAPYVSGRGGQGAHRCIMCV